MEIFFSVRVFQIKPGIKKLNNMVQIQESLLLLEKTFQFIVVFQI